MIYFDNAATSFPKPNCVIDEVVKCLKKYCGNPGRSSHALAMAAATKIYETREAVAELLSLNTPECVVFTPNATYALNLAIKGIVKPNCHYITSDIEHNSMLRPLYKCANELGCEVSIYDSDSSLRDAIIPLINDNTHAVFSTIASNVTGKIIDVKLLSQICEEYKLKLVIDASQYLGHLDLNLNDINFDVLCCAGHKALFGIQGSGFAVFGTKESIDTLVEGGSGVDSFSKGMPELLPERYEAGTLFTPAIASLCAGIQYIKRVGIETIEEKLDKLTIRTAEILSSFNDITIYGAKNGIIAFNKEKYPSSSLSSILSKRNIATRGGYHCAPLIHHKMGTSDTGAVRISLSYMNTFRELDVLYKTLKDIKL